MREITATEASRTFSALLDEVERGGSAVITRGGRRIARFTPLGEPNGAAFLEIVRQHGGPASGVDDTFEEDVAAVRRLARADLDVDPWQG